MTGKKAVEDTTFTMSVDLAVLESLGINLYSNAAAVLSELVANAYDADATAVDIRWKDNNQLVVVTDDGCGMDVKELNERFLTVGYKKRETEGDQSPKWKRPFMGRKGIGKLSVFSIAKKVSVYSTKGGTSYGLLIDSDVLQKRIKAKQPYHPQPLSVPPEHAKPGTTIVLSDLKSKRAKLTALALRKRLARRFDVLSTTPASKGGFAISVNGKRVTYEDRQELKRLEFIWEFGKKSLPAKALPKGIERFILSNDAVNATRGWKVTGWIGTAKRPTDLTDDEEAGSLKNIIVLARKRPIQEGIIEKLDFSRLFGNYVTGQIEADFLDMDGNYDDIATSDRQRLIEDDERVIALQKFLRESFLEASEKWSEVRPKREAKDALAKYPNLKKWVENRPEWQRDAAAKMIGTIASVELEKKREAEDRAALFRSGILAFERVGMRDTIADLDNLTSVKAIDLLPLLGRQEDYEEGLWGDILRSRVEAITTLRTLTRANEKEKVLQGHLYKNLWLLDPSWERAVGSEEMEQDLRKLDAKLFAKDAAGKQIHGRIDIRYAYAGGRHVIVELKRYGYQADSQALFEQGSKYYEALDSVLKQRQEANPVIEVTFILGNAPTVKRLGNVTSVDEFIANQFRPINGRVITYDALIVRAQKQYQEYLDASERARELDELLATIDNVAP